MADLIVAFGSADNVYFISSGSRTHKSHIPPEMASEINTRIKTPYRFVSIGDNGKWFMSGKDPNDSTRRLTRSRTGGITSLKDQIKDNPTGGVCFGPNNSWTWYRRDGDKFHWKYRGLGQNTIAFINAAKEDRGSNFKIMIGAGNATVLVYSNGTVRYHSCGNYLADTLSAAGTRRENLPIRYLALSPTHRDWFFIQFQDGSVTWYTSTVMGERLFEFARDKGLSHRRPRTLEVLQ